MPLEEEEEPHLDSMFIPRQSGDHGTGLPNPCAVGGACALRDRQSKRVVGSALSDRAMELASPACLFSRSPGGL